MGRARNQPQAISTDLFAGVLGSTRGNAGGNEQRDRQEAIAVFFGQTDRSSPVLSSAVSARGISYLTQQSRGQKLLVATLLTDIDHKPTEVRVIEPTVFTEEIVRAAKSAGLEVTRVRNSSDYEIDERSLGFREREAFLHARLITHGRALQAISERLDDRQENVLRHLSRMTSETQPTPLLLLTVANLLGDRQPDDKEEKVPLITYQTISNLGWMGLVKNHRPGRVFLTPDGFAVAALLGEDDEADGY